MSPREIATPTCTKFCFHGMPLVRSDFFGNAVALCVHCVHVWGTHEIEDPLNPPTTSVQCSNIATLTRRKILLPSAVHLEERLTVSQSVPEPGQQSVRQKHTVWVFCQWQMRPQAVGRPFASVAKW